MSESGKTIGEVEGVLRLIAELKSCDGIGATALAKLESAVTRVTTRFAVRVLDTVDFHHLDEDLSEGRLDPRFVPIVKKSVEMADPVFFPAALKELATKLKTSLLKLEAALVNRDLGSSSSASHEAHELYHQLQHEVEEWLRSGLD
ncbi:MAG: hypothetical protein LYZ69_01700 [Nitrososphaerales archaeon]|nr:hypothetical protein [Nitrososphaerales archaeon]